MTDANRSDNHVGMPVAAEHGQVRGQIDEIDWSPSYRSSDYVPPEMVARANRVKPQLPKLDAVEVAKVVEATRELGLAPRIGGNALEGMIDGIEQYKKVGYFDSQGLSVRSLTSDQSLSEINFLPLLVTGGGVVEDSAGINPINFKSQKNFAMLQGIRGAQNLVVAVRSGLIEKPGKLVSLTNPTMGRLAERFGLDRIDKTSNTGLITKLFEDPAIGPTLGPGSLGNEQVEQAHSVLVNKEVHDTVIDPNQLLVSGNYDDFERAVLSIPSKLQERIAKSAASEVARAGLLV